MEDNLKKLLKEAAEQSAEQLDRLERIEFSNKVNIMLATACLVLLLFILFTR